MLNSAISQNLQFQLKICSFGYLSRLGQEVQSADNIQEVQISNIGFLRFLRFIVLIFTGIKCIFHQGGGPAQPSPGRTRHHTEVESNKENKISNVSVGLRCGPATNCQYRELSWRRRPFPNSCLFLLPEVAHIFDLEI